MSSSQPFLQSSGIFRALDGHWTATLLQTSTPRFPQIGLDPRSGGTGLRSNSGAGVVSFFRHGLEYLHKTDSPRSFLRLQGSKAHLRSKASNLSGEGPWTFRSIFLRITWDYRIVIQNTALRSSVGFNRSQTQTQDANSASK